MKLVIVSGSQRENSKSLLTGRYLATLAAGGAFDEIEILDLHSLQLPLWNEEYWQEESASQACWQPVKETLASADALVLITPEYHGMATPALKNFLMLTTAEELSHKPALLVSVSASVNGVYPVSELRMTGSKNNHVCFLPDHLIIRNVETLFDESATDEAVQCNDSHLHERATYTMQLLVAYAKALKPVHQEMLQAGKPFRYGM